MPDLPSSAQAWIHALTPGPDARLRLAQCLADGVDPWQRVALVVRWNTLSLSLPEAVLMGKDSLGMEELRKRLLLIGRYTAVAETAEQKNIAMGLMEAAMEAGVPMSDLTLWRNRAGELTSEQSHKLVQRGLGQALARGGEWGADILGWLHRRVLKWTQWPASKIIALESSEDPHLRDSYWALVRQVASPIKPGKASGPG